MPLLPLVVTVVAATLLWTTSSIAQPCTGEEFAQVSGLGTTGVATDILLDGDRAYVAAGVIGLVVYDISDPFSPAAIDSADTPDEAIGVALGGTVAYVSDVTTLRILDVSGMTPSPLASIAVEARDAAVSGGYLLVASPAGLNIYNITSPASPAFVANLPTPGDDSYGVAVSGPFAYLADGSAGVQVIDWTTPTSPAIVGTFDTPGYCRDVSLDGNYAFVSDSDGGLRILDVSIPSSPVEIQSVPPLATARSASVAGDKVYVADSGAGVFVADISGLPGPVPCIGTTQSLGSISQAYSVAARDGLVYVAARTAGLQIVLSCSSASGDCNLNTIPDACEIALGLPDCDQNGVLDTCDIAAGTYDDLNANGVPDPCDISSGLEDDCNENGIIDSFEIASGTVDDFNLNGVPDGCDIASGLEDDCNQNGTIDSYEVMIGSAADCNLNGSPDSCDIAAGISLDDDNDGIPDDCVTASIGTVLVEFASIGLPSAGTIVPALATGDFNNDGFDDIVAGHQFADRAYVYLGGPSLSATPEVTITPPFPLGIGSRFGATITAGGDLNDDGFADFAIFPANGVPWGSNTYAQGHYWWGGPFVSATSAGSLQAPGPGMNWSPGNIQTGWMRHDLNGDGTDDLLQCLPAVGAGFVTAYLSPVSMWPDLELDMPNATVTSSRDFNGDGLGDFAVETWGSLQLFYGGTSAVGTGGPDQVVSTSGPLITDAGDLNGDGIDDLVGSSGVYLGNPVGLSLSTDISALPKSQIIGAGDVNGDTYDDFAVTYAEADIGAGNGGSVSLFLGGTVVDGVDDWTYGGTVPEGRLGLISASGDINGDGFSDLVIGFNDSGVPSFKVFILEPCSPWRVLAGAATDCDDDLVPDDCELAGDDCDGNMELDTCQIAADPMLDCNGNGVLDSCEPAEDCDGNQIPDSCEILSDPSLDCNFNGALDVCDIAGGLADDCNLNGVPDQCDIAVDPSIDCNLNGVMDVCEQADSTVVDLVFVLDTSTSMQDEAAALCASIGSVIADLAAFGITVNSSAYGVSQTPGGAFSCLDGDVVGTFGSTIQDSLPCCPTVQGLEDWGLATAVVAENFPWAADVRVIVPIGDEGPRTGDPCNDPGDDRDVIEAAIFSAAANGVAVSPITGTGSSPCVVALAVDLAEGTGGTAFQSSDPASDLAAAVFGLLTGLAVSNDCDQNGTPDICDIAAGGVQDCNGNGVPDNCEIALGLVEDCNGDEVPDQCEGEIVVTSTGPVGPVGAGNSVVLTIPSAPEAGGDIEVIVEVRGDFSALTESADLLLNGSAIATLFELDGSDCPENANTATVMIPAMDFNTAVDGGDAVFSLVPAATVDPLLCGGTFGVLSVTYQAYTEQDCNANGVPDICDIILGVLTDANGNGIPDECETTTSVLASDLPVATRLVGSAPNPFRPDTFIRFDVRRSQRVSLKVYDVQGRLVRTLEDGIVDAGKHVRRWDGLDRSGAAVSSGVYFYRMEAEDGAFTVRGVRLK